MFVFEPLAQRPNVLQREDNGKRQNHLQQSCEMVAVNVGGGGVLQVKLFHVKENLLPAGQVLNQAVECFEHAYC